MADSMEEWFAANRQKLERIIEHEERIVEDYKYNDAKRVVWATWRKAVIALSGFLIALAVLYDQAKSLLSALVKGLS